MSHWNKIKNKAKDVMKGNTVWGKKWENHKEVHVRLRLIGRARDCFHRLFSLLESGRHLPLTVLCGHQSHMPTVQACPSSPIRVCSTQLCWSTKGGFQSVLPLALGTSPLSVTPKCCLVSRQNNQSYFHLFKTTGFVKMYAYWNEG